MLGVFLLPAFTRLGHERQGSFESLRWNACVHRLDLGLYSNPKEFWMNGVRTHVNSKGKIPSTEKKKNKQTLSPEEDRTRDAASSSPASPTHYQLRSQSRKRSRDPRSLGARFTTKPPGRSGGNNHSRCFHRPHTQGLVCGCCMQDCWSCSAPCSNSHT